MFRNYIITALRNLYRNKANTTINVLGLTLGITCSLVLFLVIRYELSFNQHFADNDRMYRIVSEVESEEGTSMSASMQFPFAKTFATAHPEIPVTFIHNNIPARSFYVTKEGERVRFQESSSHIGLVNPEYTQVFSHEWLGGNPETALNDINSVVLTRKMAEKFFGTTDVVGQTLVYNKRTDLLITGVIEDYPKTTDFPIDILISIQTNLQYRNNQDEDGDDGKEPYVLYSTAIRDTVSISPVEILLRILLQEQGDPTFIFLVFFFDVVLNFGCNPKVIGTLPENGECMWPIVPPVGYPFIIIFEVFEREHKIKSVSRIERNVFKYATHLEIAIVFVAYALTYCIFYTAEELLGQIS